MALTKADREFMSRGERRKVLDQKRRQALAVDRAERAEPTPETAAKLIPDPLGVMVSMKLIDDETLKASQEMADVFRAVYGGQMPGARGAGGHPTISDAMAWIHANRYLPWSRKWSGIKLRAMPLQPAVIDLVVGGGQPLALTEIAAALADYARIRRERPLPPADKLAVEGG